MRIIINDDFDLKKIQISGQCFRVREVTPGSFRFITGKNVVTIRRIDEESDPVNGKVCLEADCSQNDWDEIWHHYFDMDRCYSEIAHMETGKNDFADKAIEFGRGLRILRQDKWEMLVSFIISQRKSIPAISTAVESLCEKFGDLLVEDAAGKIYSFPTPEQMSRATAEDLKACSLGYRAPYVRDAVEKVLSGELDLEKIAEYDDEALFEELIKVHGVGKKVANCVLLFAYSRCSRVPVDVWISRAIDEEFGGENIFPVFGENGGIVQQYIFYYEKNYGKIS